LIRFSPKPDHAHTGQDPTGSPGPEEGCIIGIEIAKSTTTVRFFMTYRRARLPRTGARHGAQGTPWSGSADLMGPTTAIRLRPSRWVEPEVLPGNGRCLNRRRLVDLERQPLVGPQTRASRNEAAHDDVFFESAQIVDLAHTAASVRTLVVSWNDEAEMSSRWRATPLVIPSKSGSPWAGRPLRADTRSFSPR